MWYLALSDVYSESGVAVDLKSTIKEFGIANPEQRRLLVGLNWKLNQWRVVWVVGAQGLGTN